MNRLIIVLIYTAFTVGLLSLLGCASIKSTIVLPKEFERSSKVVNFKRPVVAVPDSVYHQNFDRYSISNVDVSNEYRSSESMGQREELMLTFLSRNGITFDSITEELTSINGFKNYSFELYDDNRNSSQSVIKVECEVNFEEKAITQHSDRLFGKARQVEYEQRLTTNLVCSLTQGENIWGLLAKSNKDREVDLQLSSGASNYVLKPLMERRDFIERGKEQEKLAVAAGSARNSGVAFYRDKKQVAALSLVGRTKIYLDNSLNDNEYQLLLASGFGLAMFDWLENDWRN